jgi:hypothetical protein
MTKEKVKLERSQLLQLRRHHGFRGFPEQIDLGGRRRCTVPGLRLKGVMPLPPARKTRFPVNERLMVEVAGRSGGFQDIPNLEVVEEIRGHKPSRLVSHREFQSLRHGSGGNAVRRSS